MAADRIDVSDDPRDVRAPVRSREGDDAPPASFVVELAHFSGPLDLLLTLLREEQIDIYDIPIARIAEQFLVRIRTLRHELEPAQSPLVGQRLDVELTAHRPAARQ